MQSAKDVNATVEFLKVLLIGSPGTGKSVFASSFPTPGFVFDFSNGILIYRGLDFDYAQYKMDATGWVQFEKDLREVVTAVSEGKYQTVVVDDVTAFQSLAMQRALQLDPKRSATNGPLWNVHYGMVRNLIEGSLRRIIDLKCNLVLIAHIDIQKDEDGAVIGIEPLMTGQLSTIITGYFDEVYYTSTRKEGDKIKWMIQTVPIGMKNARSRLSGKQRMLPDFMENDYANVIKHIKLKEKLK